MLCEKCGKKIEHSAALFSTVCDECWAAARDDENKWRAMEAGVSAPCVTCHQWACVCDESYTPDQVKTAIEAFLEYGEQRYSKAQGSYFSGYGWAARCLRYHLAQLEQAGT